MPVDRKRKVTVASRAHRTLRHLARYSPWGAKKEHTSIFDELTLQEGEVPIGIYYNHDESIRDSFIVTNLGIHIDRRSSWEVVYYENIKRVPTPPGKTDVTSLRIIQRDEAMIELPVSGRKERTFDAFEVLRFLCRVLNDSVS